MSDALIDEHDAALFDLDGVVYLGPDPVPAAPDTIAELRRRGVKVGFVTNNVARSAEVVAQHLTDIGIPTEPSDVVTSGQAISDLAADTLPAGARVLIVGTESLRDEARARGLQPVESARDDPVAVIQGYDSQIAWPLLEEAGFALQAGAMWYAGYRRKALPPVVGGHHFPIKVYLTNLCWGPFRHRHSWRKHDGC